MSTGARGAGDAAFGHIAIKPKRVSDVSWWIDQPRENFAAKCIEVFDCTFDSATCFISRSEYIAVGNGKPHKLKKTLGAIKQPLRAPSAGESAKRGTRAGEAHRDADVGESDAVEFVARRCDGAVHAMTRATSAWFRRMDRTLLKYLSVFMTAADVADLRVYAARNRSSVVGYVAGLVSASVADRRRLERARTVLKPPMEMGSIDDI